VQLRIIQSEKTVCPVKIIKDIIGGFGEYNIIVKYKENINPDFSDLKNLVGNKLVIE